MISHSYLYNEKHHAWTYGLHNETRSRDVWVPAALSPHNRGNLMITDVLVHYFIRWFASLLPTYRYVVAGASIKSLDAFMAFICMAIIRWTTWGFTACRLLISSLNMDGPIPCKQLGYRELFNMFSSDYYIDRSDNKVQHPFSLTRLGYVNWYHRKSNATNFTPP